MPRLLAIDLGSHAVKISTFRGNGRQWSFEARYDVRVPQDGALPALDARLVALDALFGDRPNLRPTGSDAVAMVLPGEAASFHRLTMPFTDRTKVEQTLPFAIEAEVPFDLDEMVLGWRILSQRDGTSVLAALARRDKLETWVGALAERSLDPAVVYVDGEVMAPFATAPDGSRPPAGVPVAVVDIGHAHTTVTVVRGGQVEFARSVNVGGWAFTRAIQTALQCSWAEAEARKHGRITAQGSEEPDLAISPSEEVDPPASGYRTLPPAARQAMDNAIGLLLAEVRSTLIQAEDTIGTGIEEIRLVGGSSRIPELWDYLAQDLGVAVTRPGIDVPPAFAVANGLALHAAGQAGAPAIDLRIGPLAYRGGTDWIRTGFVYGGFGLAFFMTAAVLVFAFRYWSVAREGAATDQAIRDMIAQTFPDVPPGLIKDDETALAYMKGETEDEAHRATALSEHGTPQTIDTLYALTQAFPPHPTVTVEVSDLTISPESISFSAETDGYASSAAVEESLKKSDRFKSATKGEETKTSAGRVKFPITIPLGTPPATDEKTGKTGKEG